jgi:glycosyltransferase involved in cell wall biosynthesis
MRSKAHQQDKKVPTVGIFMPAYNQGRYIDDALDSLKNQTFQDFVIHVVDDGSTDGLTPNKLSSITYEKAIIFQNTDNVGVAKRARHHYSLLKTKYIIVLCADDVIDSSFLEKCVAFMDKYEEYGAVCTNAQFFDEDRKKPYKEVEYPSRGMTLPAMLARCGFLGTALMRKEALNETDLGGGFVRYQDWDRWISMLEKGWKLGHINEPLFYYRQVATSLSHSRSVEDEVNVRRLLLKKHAKLYKKYYNEVILSLFASNIEMIEQLNEVGEWGKRMEEATIALRKELHNLKEPEPEFKKPSNFRSALTKIKNIRR